MEIYISEYNEKMVAVLLDDEMKIVKPVYCKTICLLQTWASKAEVRATLHQWFFKTIL